MNFGKMVDIIEETRKIERKKLKEEITKDLKEARKKGMGHIIYLIGKWENKS